MDDRKRLEELRAQLLEQDLEILRAIERRAKTAQQISKLRTGAARFGATADAAHLHALEKAVGPSLSALSVRPVFSAIDTASRVYEAAPRVAYAGTEGGFSWIAARTHFGGGVEMHRADTAAHALDEVARSRADLAVVPYESLEDGLIFPTVQAIAAADLKLIGEREVAHTLALWSATGNPADVEKVYAAPQDHASCMSYLEVSHPRAVIIDVRSPLMAYDLALENHGSAAIVARGLDRYIARRGEGRELRVARENIGDEGEIRVRYGVVSRMPAQRTGADATALLFSVHDKPGALHDILQHFKEKSCNLRRIQSRPVEGWEYLFYAEVSGHVTDRPLVAALEGVKRETKTLKIIGSFPLEMPDPVPSQEPNRPRG